jgi:hypothetical protein
MGTATEERSTALRPAAPWPAADAPASPGSADWMVVTLCAWIVGGAYLDVWAHLHLALFESFFTPWHAVLYSGMVATTAYLIVLWRRSRAAGTAWDWTSGYGLSLAACALFAASGVTDAAWHTVFGIETGLNGLISPPHVLLVVSACLIVSGPMRVAWNRGRARAPWPAVISAALLLSFLTFLTQFDHPLSSAWAGEPAPLAVLRLRRDGMELGILGVLVQTGLVTGLVLLLVSRFQLPWGTLTLVLGLNGFLITAVDRVSGLTLVAVAMGAVGDLLLGLLRPSPASPVRLRVFAALWPAAAYAVYFLELLATGGVWWPLHVWTGTVLIAGAEGWLLSFLVLPGGRVAGSHHG